MSLLIMALRIKDPNFATSFWTQVEGITQNKERAKDSFWASWKEMEDKYGDEAESVSEVLPKRKHPQNPKVFQWYISTDRAKMSVNQWAKSQIAGSSKVDKTQAKAISKAMALESLDDQALEILDKHSGHALDDKLDDILEKEEMPPWMKKAIQDGHMSEAGSAITNKRKELKDKFVLGEEEEGFQKVNKLEAMVKKIYSNMEELAFQSKSSKYKMDGELKKDFLSMKTKVNRLQLELHKIGIQKKADKQTIQQLLIKGCTIYKDCQEMVKKVGNFLN